MQVEPKHFDVNGLSYEIRTAALVDAPLLSALRVQMDSETEFMDREPGEGVLSPEAYAEIIQEDATAPNHLFLVAEAGDEIAGYARCEGSPFKRLCHQTEFGICIAQKYWRHKIGRNLLGMVTHWADTSGLHKITLKVLADNARAIALYEQYGFVREGVLKDDKRLSDGKYHDTIVMGRIKA